MSKKVYTHSSFHSVYTFQLNEANYEGYVNLKANVFYEILRDHYFTTQGKYQKSNNILFQRRRCISTHQDIIKPFSAISTLMWNFDPDEVYFAIHLTKRHKANRISNAVKNSLAVKVYMKNFCKEIT